jgi:PAS domain-containing protein
MKKILALVLALLAATVPAAYAQISTGNIYGAVTDESGAVLPGATVTLSGPYTRSTVAGSQGDFRFLGLDNGKYKLTVALTGFATVIREVVVTTGQNVNLSFGMKVATVEESVTVTAETPLVDIKRRGTSTTMDQVELQDLPNARDPWGVLKAVPGVLLDRVNIAGNENGQQASAAGKGSTTSDKTFNIDGLVITDMSATGASPGYYDFGAFKEINVTTGGTDLTMATGGIGINMVTKRGTNRFSGGGRYFIANDNWSSGNVPASAEHDPRLKGSDQGNSIQQITDYGFELGGPIVKDKLWFYGTWGRQDIRLLTFTQTPDKTILTGINGKLNWQIAPGTMFSGFYFKAAKQKFGRGVGYPLQESQNFTVNQDNAYTDGGLPGGLWKAEINHTFSPSFFVSAKAAYFDTGFSLLPVGGPDDNFTLDYVAGDAIGSYSGYLAIRPQKTLNVDGNYFFAGMGGNNELKFGFGYRNNTTNSQTNYNGNGLSGSINSPTDYVAKVWRNSNTFYGGKYFSAYLGDVLTKNRFTMNLGVRYDHQTAKNFESEVPANVTFPTLLPSASFAGNDSNLISWSSFSPRVGLSYALDESRKTVLRASYANYAEQLGFGTVASSTFGENPVAASYLAYAWNDANHDRKVQAGEVDLNNFLYSGNVDPADPSAVSSTVNKVDRNLSPKRDHEFIVGIDRELGANVAVGAAYTYRKSNNWSDGIYRLAGPCNGEPTLGNCPIIGANDYTQNAPGGGNGFTAFTYSPDAALVTAGQGGKINTNRPDYSTTFNGLEFTFNKRLSNRWMMRGNVTYSGIFDASPDGVYVWLDEDHWICNERFAALFGYDSPDELNDRIDVSR